MINLANDVKFFLELQSQIKILHWQTKGLARHKAFDEVYEGLLPLVDDFVEQAMGQYGRFTLEENQKIILLNNLSEVNLSKYTEFVINYLVNMSVSLTSSNSNLLNIRDEMLALFYKLEYLLTLE